MSAGSFQDLLAAWGKNESGNNYGYVSSLGFLGRYQFSEEGLIAIGWLKDDGSVHNMDFAGGFTDKAAAYGVYDKASFLANAAAQDAACTAWFNYLVSDIERLGMTKWIGQTLNGIPITVSGMLTGGSLVGVWALKSFLESGGTAGGSDWYGTNVAEYVSRFGGYDTPFSFSREGAEGVTGGWANDTLRGEGGNDTLDGAGGNDTIWGGGGDDRVIGGSGANYLRGEAGNDVVQGGDGFDDAHGNEGNDTVYGGGGDDWVVGGKDDDHVYGDDGADVVLGNMGNDICEGGNGDDVVRGGQGDDVVYGQAGNDWLSGDRGNDSLYGGSGADTFHVFADSGQDRVFDFNASEGDRVYVMPGDHYSVYQSGSDTVVHMDSGSELVLVNTNLSSLPQGWIF